MRYVLVSAIFCLVIACTNTDAVDERSTQRTDLVIDYQPICGDDNTLWLKATIRNSTSQAIRIANGVLPWDYDGMGTKFSVTGSKGDLPRREHYPTSQQIGPELLGPNEAKSGALPLEFLFPGSESATKERPLVFHWTYWTDARKNEHDQLSGTINLNFNPCRSHKL